jgi:hypothetical protein
LPDPPSAAYHPLTAADIERRVDDLLAQLDPTRSDAASTLAGMARSIEVFAVLAPDASLLDASSQRLFQALLDLTRLAYTNRQPSLMIDAFHGYLALKSPQTDWSQLALSAAEWSVPVLLRETGAVVGDRAREGARLRFAASFEIALGGTCVDATEMHVTSARPVLRPATTAAERLYRALFLACVCAPIHGAKGVRLLEDRVLVDSGHGYRTAWTMLRAGAVTLSAASG